jgi:hypothetical protein
VEFRETIAAPMASSNPPLPAPRRTLEPTHPCIRCGREGVPADAGLCELCNPLELSQPAATQMHGIAALGILVFVVVLAVAGRAIIADTGPFGGSVVNVTPTTGGLAVTIDVTNEGTRAASITCYVSESPAQFGGSRQQVQSPLIPPSTTVRFTTTVTRFGADPTDLAVECPTP